MINELLGKEVSITTTYVGALYTLKGEIVEIQAQWLKLMHKKEKKLIYINMSQIIKVTPL